MAQRSPIRIPRAGQAGALLTYTRATYDMANDALAPLCLVGMLWCLARFLFDVRSVFASGDTSVMRYVLFWFLIAVVGIAKIEALRGGRALSLPYKAGLGFATALYILHAGNSDALFADNTGGRGLAVLINMATFAAMYWGGTAIARDCTVNEETEERAEAALMGGSDSVPSPAEGDIHQRVRPGRSVLRFSLFALALFALGQWALSRGSEQTYHQAFYSVTGYIVFALLVLALTSFSGLRLYLVGKKLTPPPTMLPMWVSATLVLVAVIVALALIIPRRDLIGEDTLVARGMRRPPTDRALSWAPTSGTARSDRQASAIARDEEQDQGAEGRKGGGHEGEAEEAQASDEGEEGGSSGGGGQQQGGEEGRGGGGSEQGEGSGEGQGQGGTPTSTSQPPPPPPHPEPTGVSDIVFWILLALAALAALWAVIRNPRGALGLLRALLMFPMQLLAALSLLLGRLSWRRGSAGTGQPAGPRRRIPTYRNPFTTGAGLPPSELILYSYQALMALAERLGTPRREDQTALEFAHGLPPRLEPLHDEVRDLSRMYLEVEYAPESDLSGHVDRLRQIWVRFDAFAATQAK